MANDRQSDSLISALASASPLFAGFALLMLGNGLQGSLIGIRASQENFGAILIGAIMAAFLSASLSAPAGRLGHYAKLGTSECSPRSLRSLRKAITINNQTRMHFSFCLT